MHEKLDRRLHVWAIFEAPKDWMLYFDVTRWRHFYPPCTVLPHKIDCTSPVARARGARAVFSSSDRHKCEPHVVNTLLKQQPLDHSSPRPRRLHAHFSQVMTETTRDASNAPNTAKHHRSRSNLRPTTPTSSQATRAGFWQPCSRLAPTPFT
jgi:hypothetical protein